MSFDKDILYQGWFLASAKILEKSQRLYHSAITFSGHVLYIEAADKTTGSYECTTAYNDLQKCLILKKIYDNHVTFDNCSDYIPYSELDIAIFESAHNVIMPTILRYYLTNISRKIQNTTFLLNCKVQHYSNGFVFVGFENIYDEDLNNNRRVSFILQCYDNIQNFIDQEGNVIDLWTALAQPI